MTEQATTTVDELPAEVRAELVAKRETGTTLAELRKQYPQYSSEQIREALPAMPKPETKTTTRRTTKAKAKQPAKRGKPTIEKPKARAPKTERKPVDAATAKKVVAMRGKLGDSGKPTSWAKIAYALKLVQEGAPKAQAVTQPAAPTARCAARTPLPARRTTEPHAQAPSHRAGRYALRRPA